MTSTSPAAASDVVRRGAGRHWRQYPFTIPGCDPARFTFPATDGLTPRLGVSTYYMDGFLTGLGGRRYAFNFVFTAMRVLAGYVHTNFITFTLFDLDAGTYGTYTDFDLPSPQRLWRGCKLTAAEDQLDVKFAGREGPCHWANRRSATGVLVPFGSRLELRGRDQRMRPMALDLDVDAERPPVPLGGDLLHGRMMFLGARETYAYFQPGLRMRGRLTWGDDAEDVEGDVGWIDRQWAPRPFNTYNDLRNSRYRSEWRALQLNNGWDLCIFFQYLRPAYNRRVQWTGVTAVGPAGEVVASPLVELEIPGFVRDPGQVRPLLRLSPGPRYMPYAYRLRIPSLSLEVEARPFVATPAQRMPIEYWTGPVALCGTMEGAPVEGLGFDERSRVWCRDFELAEVLATVVEETAGQGAVARRLAQDAREIEALLLRGGRQEAVDVLRRDIEPRIADLPGPARDRVREVAVDLLAVITQRIRAR
jgi:hypothetical protein